MKVMISSAILLALAGGTQAAEFNVNNPSDLSDGNPGDGVCEVAQGGCTIRAAVEESNALPGMDTVNIPNGFYSLDLRNADRSATLPLEISDSVNLVGESQTGTNVGGVYESRLINILPEADIQVTIKDMTLTIGLEPNGIGNAIFAPEASFLELANVTFHNNLSPVITTYGNVIARNVSFVNNFLHEGENTIIDFHGSELVMTDCLFENNGAGAVSISGSESEVSFAEIVNCDFKGNRATGRKDSSILGLHVNADVVIENSEISGNAANNMIKVASGSGLSMVNVELVNNDGRGIEGNMQAWPVSRLKDSIILGNGTFSNKNGRLVNEPDNCLNMLISEGGNQFGDLTNCRISLQDSDTAGLADCESRGTCSLPTVAPYEAIVHKPTGLSLAMDGVGRSCTWLRQGAPVVSSNVPTDRDCAGWERVPNGEFFFLKHLGTDDYILPQSAENGAAIVLGSSAWSGNWVQWSYEERGDGFGHIVNRATGKHLFLGAGSGEVELQPSTWRGDFTRWQFTQF